MVLENFAAKFLLKWFGEILKIINFVAENSTAKFLLKWFWDKLKGLELLGREKDTFKKTTVVEHDVSKNARNILLAGLNRAEAAIEAIDVTPAPEALPEPTKPLTFELP